MGAMPASRYAFGSVPWYSVLIGQRDCDWSFPVQPRTEAAEAAC